MTITPKVKSENHVKLEQLKSVVTNLQEDLTQQKIITETVMEENLKTKRDLEDLKEQLNKITESRRESDEVMNTLFEDPEFQQLIKKKIAELKL